MDYFYTYSPVTRITSIRMLIAIIALHNLEIHQMDVKIAFLNGDLMRKFIWTNPKGLFLWDKRRKYVDLLNHFMV